MTQLLVYILLKKSEKLQKNPQDKFKVNMMKLTKKFILTFSDSSICGFKMKNLQWTYDVTHVFNEKLTFNFTTTL